MTTINEIISVCSRRDAEVWRVSSRAVVQYIKATRYVVIVPDKDVIFFKSISPHEYEIVGESRLIGDLKSLLTRVLSPRIHDRIGWYLQQFIKISAILRNRDDEFVLIWDADTLPLKHLNFVDSDGKVVFYAGEEYRASYFHFLSKSLGLSKKDHFSYIAQCLPVKVGWVRAMCRDLAKGDLSTWLESVVSQLDVNEPAGFSEYESIGTYVSHYFSNEFVISSRKWFRNGMSLVGEPAKLSRLTLLGLAKEYDYISFESWDKARGLCKRMKINFRKLKYFLAGLFLQSR